jgi:hypothetical protein
MGGTPSMPGGSGGGSGSGGATRSAGAAPRLTYFKWTEARIGAFQALTPREGEELTGPKTELEHVKRSLGFDEAARRGDTRPTLVYFHWPHDDTPNGKLSTTICTRVLDDEQAARWAKLFRCVQVDMGETKAEYAKLVGAGDGPSFVALDADLKVRASIDGMKSGSKLRKAIEKAFNAFPAYRKEIRKKMASHRKMLADAKKLEKADKYEEALKIVDSIRFGDIRIHGEFEKAFSYGMLLSQRYERSLEKK